MRELKVDAARKLYVANLGLIELVTGWICRRHNLSAEEGEEFASLAQLKLLENDFAILRKFRGSSTLKTYLTTVVRRLFLDFRIHKWGKWRPSAEAQRSGEVAMMLERLLGRDGRTLEEAIEILKRNHRVGLSRPELHELAGRLPQRAPRRFESLEGIFDLPVGEAPESAWHDGERRAVARTTESVLAEAFAALPREDRLLLKMRFTDGSTVAQIAQVLGVAQRPLYRRLERSLRQLRRALEQRGVTREAISDLLDWPRFELETDFGLT